jgi:hypothetical protein
MSAYNPLIGGSRKDLRTFLTVLDSFSTLRTCGAPPAL